MKIDLSCPAEVWKCARPRTDYPACDITLYNLSDKPVNSVEVTLTQYDRNGHELEHVIHRGHSLRGYPGTGFTMTVPCTHFEGAKVPEAIIEKVWFDDNDVWRRGKAPLTDYTPNTLPASKSLEMLRYVAGSQAMGWPMEQENVWLCVCGRPNDRFAHACSRCHRSKQEVFSRYNRTAVEQAVAQKEHQMDLQSRAVREDMARLQLIREEEYNKKKARHTRTRTLLITVAAVPVLAGAILHGGIPGLNYLAARRAKDSGDYTTAITAFENLNGFLDAGKMLTECRRSLAIADLDSGDPEKLAAAAEILRADADGEALALQADYNRACLLLEAGQTDEAAALFTALDGWGDSEAQLRECAYQDALALLSRKFYVGAEEAFLALGDYKDAPERAKQAVYETCLELIENGEYSAAIRELTRISPYADSDEQIRRAWYLTGKKLENAGDSIAAGNAYQQAGSYEDAAERTRACLYAPATEAFDAGDLDTAMQLYGMIPDYQDAAVRYRLCAYTLGNQAMKDQEYTRAANLFALLPDDYEDVLELRQEVIYRPGVAAIKRRDWETAVTLLESIPGYSDADAQLVKARYGWAGALMAEDRYAEAMNQYTLLGDYSDSPKRLLAATYGEACRLLDTGAYEQAIALFDSLDGYQDSGDKLKAAQYRYAARLLEAKDAEAAKDIFASLSNYGDAATQVKACDYLLADRLVQAEKREEAANLYASLGNYSDAMDRAGALYTALAEEAEEFGQTLVAAAFYAKAGTYNGVEEKSKALYDSYYAENYNTVKDAMTRGDFILAVTLMENMTMTDLPEAYADLPDLYTEACYQAGNQLYNDRRPYDALPYYKAIPGYKNVDERLQKPSYMLLGTWVNADQDCLFIFKEDGTCYLNGEKFFFNVYDPYQILTSDSKDGTYINTHRITDLSTNRLSLSDTREGRTPNYKLVRTEDREFPEEDGLQVEEILTDEAAAATESFVVEDENAAE